jgi:hypothetical protein
MADFLFAVSIFELAKPVQIWGVREAPPVAGGAIRTSGRGRQATSAIRCATALPGTATGEQHNKPRPFVLGFLIPCIGTQNMV